MIFLLQIDLDLFVPCDETSPVEHARQKEIHGSWVHLFHESLLSFFLRKFLFLLVFIGDLGNLVLSHKFLDCHNPIQFKVDVGDVLSVHDTIEHFIEEDETVIGYSKFHFEHDFIDCSVVCVVFDAKFDAHALR